MAEKLMSAVKRGNLPGARKELEDGVDVNTEVEATTPLVAAAAEGNLDLAKLLLAHGADVNKRGEGGATPIHWACRAGNPALVAALIAAGADVNTPHETGPPLFWAAGASHARAVELLLAAGADANATASQRGVTPLFMAATVGCEDCVRALIRHGARVNVTALGAFTPLHVAAEGGHAGMAEALLDAGSDMHAQDDHGLTPLQVAAARGRRNVVELFLQRAPHEAPSPDVEQLMRRSRATLEAKEVAMAGPQLASIRQPEVEDEALAEQLRQKANAFFAAGDIAGAAKLYSLAMEHWTKNAVLWGNRAACRLKLEQWQEALEDARIARAIDPRYVKAWYREGKAAEALRRWEDAGTAFYAAAQLQPENEELLQLTKHAIQEGRKEFEAAKRRQAAGGQQEQQEEQLTGQRGSETAGGGGSAQQDDGR